MSKPAFTKQFTFGNFLIVASSLNMHEDINNQTTKCLVYIQHAFANPITKLANILAKLNAWPLSIFEPNKFEFYKNGFLITLPFKNTKTAFNIISSAVLKFHT
ncbi:MAG: hypothetical protein HRU28_08545 [Rhizobiales bacterium]|nr:hypothetical protein [Hyphomicrobiales bacterium]